MSNPQLYKRYAKILKAKISRKSRSGDPLDNVIEKIIDTSDLLDEIHKKVKNRRLIQEARKQFIITSVTSIEVLLREYFIQLLEINICAEKFKEELSKKEFSIEDIEFLNENKISKPELITYNYNFQNMSEINNAFSTALDNNFFKDLKEYSVKLDPKDEKSKPFKLGEFYQDLEWLIAQRHEFVHDINCEIKISKAAVEDITTFCLTFVSQLGFYISDKMRQLKKEKSKN